jgi:hypothetical protein
MADVMAAWFTSWDAAKRYLTTQGFEFVGAPNRWRRSIDGAIAYAEVHNLENRFLVVEREGSLSANG